MTLPESFRLEPLDRSTADRLRSAARSVYVVDATPGYPCRQCLRDAEIGEEVVLVSHDPFETDSPYRSASPIFLHRSDCGAPDLDRVPEQLTVRQLSVRAFDADEMMVDATLVDGAHLDGLLAELSADAAVESVHVHNSPRGCWATTLRRRRVA